MIPVRLLQVCLILQFAEHLEVLSMTVSLGHEATLPCAALRPLQDQCNGTTWLFSPPWGRSVPLVEDGTLHGHASDRLSLTGDCSLLIKKVKYEDKGRYTCRQSTQGQADPTGQAEVDLAVYEPVEVLSMTFDIGGVATLPCAALQPLQERCNGTTWLFRSAWSGHSATLVEDGKVQEDAEDGSGPVSLTGNCSLLVKVVQDEIRGFYTCIHSPPGLHSTASGLAVHVTEDHQVPVVNASLGGEATLTCAGSRPHSDQCGSVAWFSGSPWVRPGILFSEGRLHEDAGDRSARLSLTGNCSLVIQQVRLEDNGPYACSQGAATQRTTSELHLHVTGGTFMFPLVNVSVGDGVTLPCAGFNPWSDRCNGTTWSLGSPLGVPDTLFAEGKLHEDAVEDSDRLSLTADCSLVLKEVTPEDEGHYACRLGPGNIVSHYYLRVTAEPVGGSEVAVRVGDEATLSCAAFQPLTDQCNGTAWLFSPPWISPVTLVEEGKVRGEVGGESARLSLAADCSLVIRVVHSLDGGRYTCRQTTAGLQNTRSHVHLRVSADEPPTPPPAGPGPGWWWRSVVAPALLAAMCLSVVIFSLWARSKGRKGSRQQEEFAVIYENAEDCRASVQVFSSKNKM